MNKLNTLNAYLREYYKLHENIVLVSRPTEKTYWNDRCSYLDDNYNPNKHYNHRSVLDNEVVIEFDMDDPAENVRLSTLVENRLKEDRIAYSAWFSGGKSTHIHFLINTKNCSNIRLLKKIVMSYYARDCDVLPDLRLAENNHLVRAEFGIHEKTQINKHMLRKFKNPILEQDLTNKVWQIYSHKQTAVVKRRVSCDLSSVLESKEVGFLLSSTQFRELGDGRERVLFALIHLLKTKYTDKSELVKYLVDWYKYSGGYKLSSSDIVHKVNYHYNRSYRITEDYIKELLEEIGYKGEVKHQD